MLLGYRAKFLSWFAAIMLFFIVANLIGIIKPKGLAPFRETGFPFIFAAWGVGIERFFDWGRLGLNFLVSLLSALIMSYVIVFTKILARKV
jgi:hypothetical protein